MRRKCILFHSLCAVSVSTCTKLFHHTTHSGDANQNIAYLSIKWVKLHWKCVGNATRSFGSFFANDDREKNVISSTRCQSWLDLMPASPLTFFCDFNSAAVCRRWYSWKCFHEAKIINAREFSFALIITCQRLRRLYEKWCSKWRTQTALNT